MCGLISPLMVVLMMGSESIISSVYASNRQILKAPSANKLTPYYYSSMPPSFAILINLGISGRIRHLYSSHWHNNKCNSQQIWDPFNDQCRQLFCKDNFEIKHLRCVEKEKTDPDYNESKPFIKFLDSESKFVNVTLGLLSEQELSNNWFSETNKQLVKLFSNQLSTNCSIEVGRLINITIQYDTSQTQITTFNISFLLTDNNDRKNDDVLKEISEKIVKNKQNSFLISGIQLWPVFIHTTMPEIDDFCSKETDMPIWYWNSDFKILTKSNLTYLLVNKTGRTYYPGEYMGSVLYIQQVDDNGNSKINVSSNAVVCETTLIDETCPRIMFNRSEYKFVGRRLYTIRDNHYHDKYELTDNQSVLVCLNKPRHLSESMDGKIQSILSTSLMLMSITLLILVLVTFIRLESIRSTVNGFNSINLVICLAVMQISFLSSQYINQCRLTAVMFHFFILTTIFWSSVIAYDMHRAFTKQKFTTRPNSLKTRIVYCLIAYLLPILIVSVANLSDLFDIESIKGDYGRILHSNACWMRNPTATIIYFFLPVAFMVVYNLVLFIRIIFNIRNNMRSFSSFKKVTRNDSDSSQVSIISNENGKSKLTLNETSIYIKLSVPLGFTWVIALFSTIIPSQYEIVIKVMSYLFIIANTSQGVVLFLAFGVYKKMISCK